MSDLPSKPAAPLQMGECVIRGKLSKARKYESHFYTTVTVPSSDPYQRPSVNEVRSVQRLGDQDEVVTIRCRVTGYNGKPYRFVDKDTGESRQVVPVHNVLEAVE